MRKKTAIATTGSTSTSIRLRVSKVYMRRVRGRNLPQVHAVKKAGKRGLRNPPAR